MIAEPAPLRFGVILPNFSRLGTREVMVEVTREAEALGYDSIWASDHVMLPRGCEEPYGHVLELFTILTYLAPLTERIKLGASVLVFPQREPVLVAKQTATLDYLSGGRLILGVGGGWNAREFEYLGASFHDRGRRLDEYIRALRELWGAPEPRFAGRYVAFSETLFSPRPVQPGGPPILIGGTSAASLRRAAVLGDGWHVTGLTPAQFADGLGRIRDQAGDRHIEGSLRIRTAVGRRLPVQRSVTDGLPRADLSGSVDEIAARLREYQLAGVEQVMCHFGDDDGDRFLEDLRRFAAEVCPAVRGSRR